MGEHLRDSPARTIRDPFVSLRTEAASKRYGVVVAFVQLFQAVLFGVVGHDDIFAPRVPRLRDGIGEFLVRGLRVHARKHLKTVRCAYDAAAIRRLKRERDGVIYISGSGQLVRALLSEGLVDELHLFVYPVALGKGAKLWSEDN